MFVRKLNNFRDEVEKYIEESAKLLKDSCPFCLMITRNEVSSYGLNEKGELIVWEDDIVLDLDEVDIYDLAFIADTLKAVREGKAIIVKEGVKWI